VKVQIGKRKGKVLIEFATLDDLQRICDVIGLGGLVSTDTAEDRPPQPDDDGSFTPRSVGASIATMSSDPVHGVLPPAVGLSVPPR
jgi:hypothetical protein